MSKKGRRKQRPRQKANKTFVGEITGSKGVAIGDGAHATVIERLVYTAVHVAVSHRGLLILAAALVLATVLAAMIFNIPTLFGFLPTPAAFPTAEANESLLIVANFDDRSAGKYKGIDPGQYLYEKLLAQSRLDQLDVRIERLHETVNDNTAKATGQVYSATMLIWGWYDGLTITFRLERIKFLGKGYISTQEGHHFSLSQQDNVEFSVATDLPSQATYVTLFILGMDAYGNGRFDGAREYLTSAISTALQCVECSTNPSEAYLQRGNIYLLRDIDHRAALADYNEALRLNPGHVDSHIQRGLAYFKLGEYGEALQDFDYVVEQRPNNSEAYNNRGIVHLLMDNFAVALADFNRALELDPGFSHAYRNRGNVYLVTGNYESALADYSRVIELEPLAADDHRIRGYTYYLMNAHPEALEDLDRALELDPKLAEAYNIRGDIYRQLGDHQSALADFAQALAIEPEDAIVYNNRAVTYVEMEDYESALLDINKAISIDPGYANAYLTRGAVYFNMDQLEIALADCDQALTLDPELAGAHRSRGEIHRMQGDYLQAIGDYTHALELQPSDADTYYSRGLTEAELGNYEKAIRDFDRASELGTEKTCEYCVYFQRGQAYLKQHMYQPAISDLTHAIQLEPGEAITYFHRGQAYDKQEEYELAVADYTKVIELQPQADTTYFYRGLSYKHLGRTLEAIADFEQYLALSDDEGSRAQVEQWIKELEEE